MNSETPANSESDKIIFESASSPDTLERSDESATEKTFDPNQDVWSSDPIAEVIPESEEPEPSAAFETAFDRVDEEDVDSEAQTELEPELFVDTWLDEPQIEVKKPLEASTPNSEVEQLQQQKADLQQEIVELKAHREQVLLHQVREAQENMARMIEEGTKELIERKTALRIEIEQLERRQARINQEMRSNFAGSSKELAIRVQGFKEYLVGSLQDLASAADKLELARPENTTTRKRERSRNQNEPSREGSSLRNTREGREGSSLRSTREGREGNSLRSTREGREGRDSNRSRNRRNGESGRSRSNSDRNIQGQFSEPTFADQSRRIRQLLDKYCNSPDYYGSPWQLRRTFEQSQAKKVQEWFFSQGGRGAIDSMGSRLQNILVASATISILHDLYRDPQGSAERNRAQFLVLTDTPENLGEWRRGLEDSLGISRRDFGTNRGIVLFDSPEVLVQRAERLIADKLLPVIIIDETEELLNLSMLKFPIWLAFASTNKSSSANYLY